MFFDYKSYIKQIIEATGIEKPDFAKTRPILGGFYTYNYSPKTRDKLKYYDIFPMTVIIKYEKNGFLGLNFHYLPLKDREILFKLLLPMRMKIYNKTIIKMNYMFLQRLCKTYWTFCLKRYLYSHIKTKMLFLDVDKWKELFKLPVISFKKQYTHQVYQDFIRHKFKR